VKGSIYLYAGRKRDIGHKGWGRGIPLGTQAWQPMIGSTHLCLLNHFRIPTLSALACPNHGRRSAFSINLIRGSGLMCAQQVFKQRSSILNLHRMTVTARSTSWEKCGLVKIYLSWWACFILCDRCRLSENQHAVGSILLVYVMEFFNSRVGCMQAIWILLKLSNNFKMLLVVSNTWQEIANGDCQKCNEPVQWPIFSKICSRSFFFCSRSAFLKKTEIPRTAFCLF